MSIWTRMTYQLDMTDMGCSFLPRYSVLPRFICVSRTVTAQNNGPIIRVLSITYVSLKNSKVKSKIVKIKPFSNFIWNFRIYYKPVRHHLHCLIRFHCPCRRGCLRPEVPCVRRPVLAGGGRSLELGRPEPL